MMNRSISTAIGPIPLPAFLPVTTYGGRYPLDELVRSYLSRFAPALMVSHYYAQSMPRTRQLPVFVDSGGYASLFSETEIVEEKEFAYLRTKEGTTIRPDQVLAFQQQRADIGATLDFLVTPNTPPAEAQRRLKLTARNAMWALQHREPGPFRLVASLQARDVDSARRLTEFLAPHPFDGFALGGMVPRIGQPDTILRIVTAIRSVDADRPLHVFGIGKPALVRALFDAGVDSVDSSSYVQYAADKRYLEPTTGEYRRLGELGEIECACTICRRFSREYLMLKGEANNMALALHNLAATVQYVQT